jgi:hypothetical protein
LISPPSNYIKIVYTLDDCLQACVSFNHYADSNNCTAVQFSADMGAVVLGREANCFMATDTGISDLSDSNEGNLTVTGLITYETP